MAKDYEKKWDKMDPYERRVATREMAEFYDVASGPTVTGRPGANWSSSGRDTSVRRNDNDSTGRAINDAMANGATADYLRYSGQDLPHANDVGGMWSIYRTMEDDHEQNSGGSFNNASDALGVANRAFEADRDNFAQNIVDDVMSQVDLNPGNTNDDKEEDEKEYNYQSLEEAYNTGNLSPEYMDALSGTVFGTSAQKAAQELLAKTVEDVASGNKLLNTDKYLIDYGQPYNGIKNVS